jgi:hypothetical protein
MSDLVNLTRVTENIQGYQLQTPADMVTALDYIGQFPSNNYSGQIQMQNNGGTRVWTLLVNNVTNNASGFATIGDIIVIENGANVSICKQADFGSLYTVS